MQEGFKSTRFTIDSFYDKGNVPYGKNIEMFLYPHFKQSYALVYGNHAIF